MDEFPGNARKDKASEPAKEPEAQRSEKKLEKVVSEDAVIQKKGMWRKFKDLIIEADFRTTTKSVFFSVMLPAAKKMVLEAGSEGLARILYKGDSAVRHTGSGRETRVNYAKPVHRALRGDESRFAMDRSSRSRQNQSEVLLASEQDAEIVLERMKDILDSGYDVVSVSDLYELIGEPSNHVDTKWGWDNLRGTRILNTREGWLLDLPPPIQL